MPDAAFIYIKVNLTASSSSYRLFRLCCWCHCCCSSRLLSHEKTYCINAMDYVTWRNRSPLN